MFRNTISDDSEQTLFLIEKFVFMKGFIETYEECETELYHADKEGEYAWIATGRIAPRGLENADLIHLKRAARYQKFRMAITAIVHAWDLIEDDEVKNAIKLRFFDGHPFMKAVGMSYSNKSTFSRRLEAGIDEIANTLKSLGILDIRWIPNETKRS